MSIPSMYTSHTLIRFGPFDGTLLSPSVTQPMEGCQDYGKSSYDAQLAKTGYHTGLIHFVQYLMEKSVCMVSEGHVEPVDG